MPPSLRQIAVRVDRVQRQVAELQTQLAAMIDAEARPQPRTKPAKRKERWVGPVPAEIREARLDVWWKRVHLARDVGILPTAKQFAIMHNQHPSLVSRWLTAKERSIEPGCTQDQTMWRCVNSDNEEFEAMLATRHGTRQKTNPPPTFRAIM